MALFLALALTGLCAGQAAAQDSRPSLALLPVVIYSAESDEYLRDGLAAMIASRFEQVGAFDIVRVEDREAATTHLSEAVVAGNQAGADFVLFGSFTRFGEGASLDMQAVSTQEGQGHRILREIFVHSGSIGEVIPDLEDLVGKVTRFAISGYQSPKAVSAPGPLATTIELETRVRALEAELTALKAAVASGSRD